MQVVGNPTAPLHQLYKSASPLGFMDAVTRPPAPLCNSKPGSYRDRTEAKTSGSRSRGSPDLRMGFLHLPMLAAPRDRDSSELIHLELRASQMLSFQSSKVTPGPPPPPPHLAPAPHSSRKPGEPQNKCPVPLLISSSVSKPPAPRTQGIAGFLVSCCVSGLVPRLGTQQVPDSTCSMQVRTSLRASEIEGLSPSLMESRNKLTTVGRSRYLATPPRYPPLLWVKEE